MQDFPLTITSILRHGRKVYANERVRHVDRCGAAARQSSPKSPTTRIASRPRSTKLGVQPGDRVGTFCWNTQEHLEAYFAIPCIGAVLHTLNIRLFPEQLAYVINHGEDKIVIVDDSLIPLLARVVDELQTVEKFVVDRRRRRIRARRPRDPALPRPHRCRGARLRVPGTRRTGGRGDVLHVGYDRQPEGRRVLAPLVVPALARRHDARRARLVRARARARDRPDSSMRTHGAFRTRRSCAALRS